MYPENPSDFFFFSSWAKIGCTLKQAGTCIAANLLMISSNFVAATECQATECPGWPSAQGATECPMVPKCLVNEGKKK